MWLCYILKCKPFVENIDNILELINEVPLLLIFIFLTPFANQQTSIDTNMIIGFVLTFFILALIVWNFTIFVVINLR